MAGFTIPDTPPTTQITDLAGDADQALYTDANGAVSQVPLGAAGTVLTSQGPGVAPTFEVPSAESPIPLILALGG